MSTGDIWTRRHTKTAALVLVAWVASFYAQNASDPKSLGVGILSSAVLMYAYKVAGDG
jgi:hypothetical protein